MGEKTQSFLSKNHPITTKTRSEDRTRSGQGLVALVSGEAGIGESRLVAEVKAYAAAQDFLLLQGSCFQIDSSYPYAPLLDLLRTLAAPTSLEADPHPITWEFAQLLPEFAPSLTVPASTPLPDPEQEKRRLFAALTRFFKDRTSQHPVLLVIEDLHWCDDISLEFLQSLAHYCATLPLLILMTYRSDEVQPGLQRFLAAGAGLVLAPQDVNAEIIRANVLALLNEPVYQDGARRLQREIAAMPGPEEAVRLIEEVVAANR